MFGPTHPLSATEIGGIFQPKRAIDFNGTDLSKVKLCFSWNVPFFSYFKPPSELT